MNLPSGLVFYLDFQYGTAQPNFTSGDSIYGANSDKTKNVLPSLSDPDSGLYNNKFGYSINEKTLNVAAAASASATLSGILNHDTRFSQSISDNSETFGAINSPYFVVTVPKSELTALGADLDAVKAFTVSSNTAAGDRDWETSIVV